MIFEEPTVFSQNKATHDSDIINIFTVKYLLVNIHEFSFLRDW